MAAKDAGIKLSPHIKPYAGRRLPSRRTRAANEEEQQAGHISNSIDGTSASNWTLLWSKFPDFDPSWPEELRKNWLDGFQTLSKICNLTPANDR